MTVFAFLGGALAIGIGFGTQNLLKNLISGVMLLVERPLKVGDFVQVGGISGTVSSIGLRSSVVRAGDGIETLIPNSTFVESAVTNWTYSNRRIRRKIAIGVAYSDPPREVCNLLLAEAERHGVVLRSRRRGCCSATSAPTRWSSSWSIGWTSAKPIPCWWPATCAI